VVALNAESPMALPFWGLDRFVVRASNRAPAKRTTQTEIALLNGFDCKYKLKLISEESSGKTNGL